MPKIGGFELRNRVFTNEQLQTKCIPYLFFTTSANKKSVIDAYTMSVQGFFVKPNSMQALENTIRKIVEYWQECIAPNQFDWGFPASPFTLWEGLSKERILNARAERARPGLLSSTIFKFASGFAGQVLLTSSTSPMAGHLHPSSWQWGWNCLPDGCIPWKR